MALKKKDQGAMEDRDRTPVHQPQKISAETEEKIRQIRGQTGYGRRRVKRELKRRYQIEVYPQTIDKVIKRLGLPKKHYKSAWRGKTRQSYRADSLLPWERNEVDTKEILDKKGLPREIYQHFRQLNHIPRYQWTWTDVASRVRFLAYSHECSWTNGQTFLRYVRSWLALFGVTGPLNISIDGGREWQATTERSFQSARKEFYHPLMIEPSVIRKGHPEDNSYVERSHKTDDEEFYVPYGLNWNDEADFLRGAEWWQIMYNTVREHEGIDDLTPLQKLGKFQPQTHPGIVLIPPIILDRHFYPEKVVQNVCGVYHVTFVLYHTVIMN